MDELFTATNYKEGVGAYVLTEDTIQIPNNISIITTFELLTKLSKKNKEKLKIWKWLTKIIIIPKTWRNIS